MINDRMLKISLEAGITSFTELLKEEKEKKEPNASSIAYYEGGLHAYKSALKDLEWQRKYEAEQIEKEMKENENNKQLQPA